MAATEEAAGMNVDEQQVNDALRALDEAHRLQRIQRNEYRYRRRMLFESLGRDTAGTGDTVRRVVLSGVMQQPDVLAEGHDAGSAASAEGGAVRTDLGARPLAAWAAVLFGVAAVGVMLFCWFVFAY
ncbi:hypothetical protein OKW30_002234 [Paraburkholderia sp. Clong3]|uniref:hypothetical protein n=1 Tax=Paraburkholderia sp. Clong3 TaxID=2991061 RepID=UPI003D1F891D